MKKLWPLLWLLSPASCAPPPTGTLRPESVAVADNRAEFQARLDDSGLLDLRGRPGRYVVGMPPPGKPFASLRMPVGGTIIGDGPGLTTIAFVGDPGGGDWRGVLTSSGWSITGVSLEVDSPAGAWTEQTHLIEEIGPQTGGELSNATLSHPAVAGSSRGDCLRLRCYEPLADGTADRRCWDLSVHNVTFANCARSSVSVYAALHGHMMPPDEDGEIHSSARVHHTTHLNTCDQDFDGEGGGGIGGAAQSEVAAHMTASHGSRPGEVPPADVFEWDNNTHMVGLSSQSALAISVYPGSIHLHHNTVVGRGVDVMGGNHEIDHNTVTLTVPNGGSPLFYRRKVGTTYIHDETWTRAASAGPGPVFVAAQKITAPTGVRLESVKMFQHTASTAVGSQGIVGLLLRSVTVVDDGPPSVRYAIRIEGTNGPSGVRSTGIVIVDSSFQGVFRAAVSVSGSYAGVGTIDLHGDSAPGAVAGMVCETPNGITGPIIYANNAMPGAACALPSSP